MTVREDRLRGIYIAGVTEEYVTSHEELLGIMAAGAANRAVAATGMNEGSSRSHSVFTITVTQKDVNNNSSKAGKLVLVDLAGSEMVRKTNATGQQLEEAKTINKSLSALGQVINALTDEKQTHVPYRDSKLTRILQDSLGGNSKTVLITQISPTSYNANETVSTLRFGVRAKSIENKVTINQTRSVEELEALLLRAEKAIDAQTAHIMALTAQLQGGGKVSSSSSASSSASVSGNDSDANGDIISQLQKTIDNLNAELDDEKAESSRKDSELSALGNLLKDKERLLVEASELLMEAQQHYESQRERSEQLARDKAEASGGIESLRAEMKEELEKTKYDLEEMKVTNETLRKENEQLAKELSELSGDQVTTGVRSTSSVVNNSSTLGKEASGRDSIISLTSGSTSNINDEQYKSQVEIKKKEIASFLSKSNVSGDVSSYLENIVNSIINLQDQHMSGVNEKLATLSKQSTDQLKKIKDYEVQRTRLEKDLQSRAEKAIKLQLSIDSMRGMDGETIAENYQQRDAQQMKSLQQRLEQLVAVHRQLLRKFASLELENVEYRKKIQLRDERIKTLEGNSKGLTSSMRQQAEMYVLELQNVREQIQLLRSEYNQRVEAAGHYQRQEGPRTLRGGDKSTVRGGSKHNLTPTADTNNNPIPDTKVSSTTPFSKGSSIFSRLLGSSSK